MPNVRLCAVCKSHDAKNYGLTRPFPIPEIKGKASVNAGSLDLCDSCWDRLVNRRTLSLDKIEERIAMRKSKIIEARTQTEFGI